GCEGRCAAVPGPKGDAPDRHDLDPRVLQANRLAGRSVTQVVAGRAALEPETKPFARHTLGVPGSRSRDRTLIKRWRAARSEFEGPPDRRGDPLDGRHVRVLDLPVRVW